jgi:hypothetical protein
VHLFTKRCDLWPFAKGRSEEAREAIKGWRRSEKATKPHATMQVSRMRREDLPTDVFAGKYFPNRNDAKDARYKGWLDKHPDIYKLGQYDQHMIYEHGTLDLLANHTQRFLLSQYEEEANDTTAKNVGKAPKRREKKEKTLRREIDRLLKKKPKWLSDIEDKLDFDLENNETENEKEGQRVVTRRAFAMTSALVANLEKEFGPITAVDALYCFEKTMFGESMSDLDDIVKKTEAGTYHTTGWAKYGHVDDSEEPEKKAEAEAEVIDLTDDSDE